MLLLWTLLCVQVLVTGSLYMVGDMLRLLGNPQPGQQEQRVDASCTGGGNSRGT